MTELSYYKEAKKQGWKPDHYKATVILKDKEQVTITLEGNYYYLIKSLLRYKNYNMTSEWVIYKNNKKVSLEEFMELMSVAEEIN